MKGKISQGSPLVCHGLLCIVPVPAPVEQSDQKERPPEYEVGQGDHQEHLGYTTLYNAVRTAEPHLDPGHPLSLQPLDVDRDLVRVWQ